MRKKGEFKRIGFVLLLCVLLGAIVIVQGFDNNKVVFGTYLGNSVEYHLSHDDSAIIFAENSLYCYDTKGKTELLRYDPELDFCLIGECNSIDLTFCGEKELTYFFDSSSSTIEGVWEVSASKYNNVNPILDGTFSEPYSTVLEDGRIVYLGSTSDSVLIFEKQEADENLFGIVAAPTQLIPILNSSLGTNLTTENLKIYPNNVNDSDGDSVTNITGWRINGTSLSVLLMPFDTNVTSANESGSIRDYSKFQLNGTGGATLENQTPNWTLSGRVGGAYDFDGVNDFVNIQDHVAINFTPSTDFSISAWVRRANTTSPGGYSEFVVVDKRDSGSGVGYLMYVGNNNRLIFNMNNADRVSSTSNITMLNWHHLFITVNRSENVSMYIDGLLQNTTNISGMGGTQSANQLTIGGRSYTQPWNIFYGRIDEVRIFNRSITASQVWEFFLAGNKSMNNAVMQSDETKVGDLWEACITVNDGTSDGYSNCSNNLTIVQTDNPPTTTLNLPTNATSYGITNVSARIDVNFNCSAVDDNGLRNITLYLWNSTGLYFTQQTGLSGTDTSANWTPNLPIENYTWNCLAEDSTYQTAWAGNFTLYVGYDSDGDGVADEQDTVQGNESNVDVQGVANLNVTIAGNTTNGTFSGEQEIAFFDGETQLLNFTHNFSEKALNFSRITIKKDGNSIITNFGNQTTNKTIYLPDTGIHHLCVRDADLNNRSDMTLDCSGIDEIDFSACVGGSISIGSISCFDEGTRFRFEGLNHSGIWGTFTEVTVNSTFNTNHTYENLTAYNGSVSDSASTDWVYYDWLDNNRSIALVNLWFDCYSSSEYVEDLSNWDNNATIIGSPNCSRAETDDGLGAYILNASGNWLNVSADSTSGIQNYNEQFSAVIWMKPLSTGNGASDSIVSQYNSVGASIEWGFFYTVASSNQPWFIAPDAKISVNSSTSLNLNQWYMVSAVYDGSTAYIYIDGVLDSSQTGVSGPIVVGGNNLGIGATWNGVSPSELGIKGFLLFNRSLSAEQILALNQTGPRWAMLHSDFTLRNHSTTFGPYQHDYTAAAMASDGENVSTPVISNQVGIIDVPPDNVTANITTESGLNTTIDVLIASNSEPTDNESEDVVTVLHDWRENNESVSLINAFFESSSNNSQFRDYSTWENNFSISGSAAFNHPCGYRGTSGCVNLGTGKVQTGTLNHFNIYNGTVEMWIRPHWNGNDGVAHHLLSINDNNANDLNDIVINKFSNNLLYFTICNGAACDSPNAAGSFFVAETVYYVVMTWDYQQRIYGYVDGVEKVNAASTKLPNPNNIQIGKNDAETTNGAFDIIAFRMYNYSITPDVILAHNTSGPHWDQYHLPNSTTVGFNFTAELTPNDGYEDGVSSLTPNITITDLEAGLITTFDETDDNITSANGIPGMARTRITFEPLFIYANVTNQSNDVAIDDTLGNCSINFTDGIAFAEFPMNYSYQYGLWQFNYSNLSMPAMYNYSINCTSTVLNYSAEAGQINISQPSCGTVINTSVNLVRNLSTVTGNSQCTGHGLVANEPNIFVNCSGFAITGDQGVDDMGINNTEAEVDGLTVGGCNIFNFGYGMFIQNAQNNIVEYSNFTNNLYGINVDSSPNTSIRYNNLSDWAFTGIALTSSHESDINNTYMIDANAADAISITTSERCLIFNNTVYSFADSSLSLSGSHNNTILANYFNVTSASDVIKFSNSNDNIIQLNQILRTSAAAGNDGFSLTNSDSNSISNNTFIGHTRYSLSFTAASINNNIWENRFNTSGVYDLGANNQFCVNGWGNMYLNMSLAADALGVRPATECGPNPTQHFYVVNRSDSLAERIDFGGSAIYRSLREALLNTNASSVIEVANSSTIFYDTLYMENLNNVTLRFNGSSLNMRNEAGTVGIYILNSTDVTVNYANISECFHCIYVMRSRNTTIGYSNFTGDNSVLDTFIKINESDYTYVDFSNFSMPNNSSIRLFNLTNTYIRSNHFVDDDRADMILVSGYYDQLHIERNYFDCNYSALDDDEQDYDVNLSTNLFFEHNEITHGGYWAIYLYDVRGGVFNNNTIIRNTEEDLIWATNFSKFIFTNNTFTINSSDVGSGAQGRDSIFLFSDAYENNFSNNYFTVMGQAKGIDLNSLNGMTGINSNIFEDNVINVTYNGTAWNTVLAYLPSTINVSNLTIYGKTDIIIQGLNVTVNFWNLTLDNYVGAVKFTNTSISNYSGIGADEFMTYAPDINRPFNLSLNRTYINTTTGGLPEFNTSATVYFRGLPSLNVNYFAYVDHYDGNGLVRCPDTVCTELTNDTTTFALNVTGFSEYQIHADVEAPAVAWANATPPVANLSDVINVTASVTDLELDVVLAEIIYPNGSSTNLTLFNETTGDVFNGSFTDTTGIGRYNITIFANDTSGNINSTANYSFVLNNAGVPAVAWANATPPVGNLSDVINITTNATDSLGLDDVLAEIVYPNGSSTNLTLANETADIFNGSFTDSLAVGYYKVTIFANNTGGTQNFSVNTSFIINELILPNVFWADATPPVANQTDVINISANVTDNYLIDTVLAQVIYPNGSSANLTLVNETLVATYSVYNGSFTDTNGVGRYNITIFANDTSGNINFSVNYSFIINDVTVPAVYWANATPPVANQSDLINITANVTDAVLLNAVSAQVVYPNGSAANFTMQNVTADIFNYTFSDSQGTGRYNITIFADDSSGNVNASTNYSFIINDVTVPAVTSPGVDKPNANQTDAVNISAAVADDHTDLVVAEILYPNGTRYNFTMINQTTNNVYNVTFTWTAAPGRYNVTFFANDTSGNLNDTENTSFVIADVVAVNVVNITPVNGSTYDGGTLVNISVNASDVYFDSITVVYANVTLPNSSKRQLTLIANGTPDIYNASYTDTSLPGIYSIDVIANDSALNSNSSDRWFFLINDTVPPQVHIMYPGNDTTFNTSVLRVEFNVSDDGVGTVNCTLVTNGTEQVGNSAIALDTPTNLSVALADGDYRWVILCIDDQNNENRTINFTAKLDVNAPEIYNATAAPATGDAGTLFNLTFNVHDASIIGNATGELQSPDENTNTTINFTRGVGAYNFTFNSSGYPAGIYYVDVFTNDSLAHTQSYENVFVISITNATTNTTVDSISSIDMGPSTIFEYNGTESTNVYLSLILLADQNSTSLSTVKYEDNPTGVSIGGSYRVLRYVKILVTNQTNANISSAGIRINYSQAEVTAHGIDETKLKIFRYNESLGIWVGLATSVNAGANFALANTTGFSMFAVAGTPPSESAPASAGYQSRSSGGGGAGGAALGYWPFDNKEEVVEAEPVKEVEKPIEAVLTPVRDESAAAAAAAPPAAPVQKVMKKALLDRWYVKTILALVGITLVVLLILAGLSLFRDKKYYKSHETEIKNKKEDMIALKWAKKQVKFDKEVSRAAQKDTKKAERKKKREAKKAEKKKRRAANKAEQKAAKARKNKQKTRNIVHGKKQKAGSLRSLSKQLKSSKRSTATKKTKRTKKPLKKRRN